MTFFCYICLGELVLELVNSSQLGRYSTFYHKHWTELSWMGLLVSCANVYTPSFNVTKHFSEVKLNWSNSTHCLDEVWQLFNLKRFPALLLIVSGINGTEPFF